MSTQYLFNRYWAVTVYPEQGGQGVKYENIRVVFDITKSVLATPNKAKVDLFNIDFQQNFVKGTTIQVVAGYVGLVETIFLGDVARANLVRSGAEFTVTFEAGDGERQLVYAKFNKGYAPKTPYKRIFEELAEAMGLQVGTVLGIPSNSTNSGESYTGTVKSALDKLTKRFNLQWSIQNNELQINPITSHLGSESILLTKETGLIGAPYVAHDHVTAKCLLNPKIRPGGLVTIKSQQVDGTFRVNSARYQGDTHGNKWHIDLECVRVNFVQILSPNAGFSFSTENIA